MRIDKWLWAARFYKTRSLATEEIDKGRVLLNGANIKPAKEIRVGDRLSVRIGVVTRTVLVRALLNVRGPAPQAATMYEETPDSIQTRTDAAEARRLSPEPALSIEQGRPTKRDRRNIDDARGWNDRWSASLE